MWLHWQSQQRYLYHHCRRQRASSIRIVAQCRTRQCARARRRRNRRRTTRIRRRRIPTMATLRHWRRERYQHLKDHSTERPPHSQRPLAPRTAARSTRPVHADRTLTTITVATTTVGRSADTRPTLRAPSAMPSRRGAQRRRVPTRSTLQRPAAMQILTWQRQMQKRWLAQDERPLKFQRPTQSRVPRTRRQ